MTNVTIALTTGVVGAFGPAAIAGYGVGTRLEYLLVPLSFGFGGAAGRRWSAPTSARASASARCARPGSAAGCAFALTEAIGVAAALFPAAWLTLFEQRPGDDRGRLAPICASSARSTASSGSAWRSISPRRAPGALKWPLLAGCLRMVDRGRRRLAAAALDRQT